MQTMKMTEDFVAQLNKAAKENRNIHDILIDNNVKIDDNRECFIDYYPVYLQIEGKWYSYLSGEYFEAIKGNPKDDILLMDLDSNESVEELLSWYGYDVSDILAKASKDYVGEVKIWKEVYYYPNTITNDISGFIVDEYNNKLVFDSYDEAYEYLKSEGLIDYEYYSLSYGEYSSPDFWIVGV